MASSGITSFQKKTKSRVLQIPGTKTSLHNNQLLISTGIPSLDSLLGGGVAVGTVVVVEADTFGSYSRLMMKYFCAESVMCGHKLFLASADVHPDTILKELPGAIVDDPESQPGAQGSEDLTIAWRYKNLPQVQSTVGGSRFGHYYDLTRNMDEELLKTANTSLHYADIHAEQQSCDSSTMMRPSYAQLLVKIRDEINSGFSTSHPSQQRNILRIGLHSLGSPLWGELAGLKDNHIDYDPSLARFLFALRALLRSAFAVCLITMPTHLFADTGLKHRVERLSDTVLRLESFAGSDKEKNPVYKEYHGLFKLVKLPRLNSLHCHMPDTLDLAFKLRRKKFTIEKLHLPPELSETASRSQEDPLKPVASPQAFACSSSIGTGSGKLDF